MQLFWALDDKLETYGRCAPKPPVIFACGHRGPELMQTRKVLDGEIHTDIQCFELVILCGGIVRKCRSSRNGERVAKMYFLHKALAEQVRGRFCET